MSRGVPEGWHKKSIGNIAMLTNGRGFKASEWQSSGLPIIRIQNLNGSAEYNYYSGSYEKQIKVENGDLLFAWSGSRGTSFGPYLWKNGSGLLNQHIWKVVPSEEVSKKFLLMALGKLTQKIEDEAHGGSALVHITKKRMESLSIFLPPLPEQKRIADILSSVDEAIAATQAVIEQTRKVKEGLLQDLLTRGIGHTRFKQTEIGEIPEAWEVKRGDEIADKITKGQSPRWQGFEYQESGVLFVTSENVRSGWLDISKPKFLPYDFNDKLGNSQLQKGDILINIVGASIGRSCLFLHDGDVANINQAVCLFRVGESNDGCFFSYVFQCRNVVSRLGGIQSETARPNLSLGNIREIKLPVPPIREQKKIVELLQDVDEVINANKGYLAQLQKNKHGLMQDLLSGKIRVAL